MRLNDLKPRMRADKLENVDVNKLKELNVTHIWLDVDNTVSPWGCEDVSVNVKEWVKNACDCGFKVSLVTNGNKERVDNIAKMLNIDFYKSAGKPNKRQLKKLFDKMGIKNGNCVALIGDQLFTDMLAANRLGMVGVLLCPICKREWLATKIFNRSRERIVWKRLFADQVYSDHWKNCL